MSLWLIPDSTDPLVQPIEMSWVEWAYLEQALILGGADDSLVAEPIDGFFYPMAQAEQWSRILSEILPRLREVKVVDELYASGFRAEPSLAEGGPLSENRRQWLASAGAFFTNSDGFERW